MVLKGLLPVLIHCLVNLNVQVTSQLSGPIVNTTYGKVRGTRRDHDFGFSGGITTVDEFLGIPYAKPPVGERRLQAPEELSSWPGVLDATKHGHVCPQDGNFDLTKEDFQDEDCLYLNIFSPYQASQPDVRYPVMVFIHGGSYLYGSGNRYNGSALVQYGVLLVAINYRLGALGFLTTGDSTLVGNFGLRDQIQALKWIKKNIFYFRGDPNKVTIFGSSAGGASVGLLMFSPLAKGLFHRCIAQSGTANAMWASHTKGKDALKEDVKRLTRGFGCYGDTNDDITSCLKSVHWSKFKWNQICKILLCTEVDPLFKPVVDGNFMKFSPNEYLTRGEFPVMSYMTGTVRAEFGDFYSENYTKNDLYSEVDDFLKQRYPSSPSVISVIRYEYTPWSKPRDSTHHNASSRHHMYTTYRRAEVLSDLGLVAPTSQMAAMLATKPAMKVFLYHLDNDISYHSVELNYVFGVPYMGGDVDEMGIMSEFNETDKYISQRFMRLWTEFAKHGTPTPNKTEGLTWLPVNTSTMPYLYLRGKQMEMRQHLRAEKVALWNTLIPELLSTPGQKATSSFDTTTWVFLGLTACLLILVILLLCVIIHGNQKDKAYSQLLRGSSSNSYAVNL